MSNQTEHVKFIVPACRITRHGSNSDKYRQLLDEVFGICLGRCDWEKDIEITCRFDQFGKFLLRRHELGLQNQFSELTPVRIKATDPIHKYDVTDRKQ